MAGSPTSSVSAGAPASSFGRHDVVGGELEPQAALRRPALDIASRVEELGLDERLADGHAARLEERVSHRATNQQRVHTRDQVLDHLELVRHLRAAKNRDERPLGILEHLPEVLDFLRHQEAGRSLRDVMDDALGRRMRAMRGPERIVDVDVGERGERFREAGVVLLLLRVEPQVLEQDDAAFAGLRDRLRRRLADAVFRERDGPPEQLRQPRRHGTERILGIRLALRPPEVRREDDGRALLEGVLDRREGRADARVLSDPAVFDGYVEIDPDERLLPERSRSLTLRAATNHSPFFTMKRSRSTQRLE